MFSIVFIKGHYPNETGRTIQSDWCWLTARTKTKAHCFKTYNNKRKRSLHLDKMRNMESLLKPSVRIETKLNYGADVSMAPARCFMDRYLRHINKLRIYHNNNSGRKIPHYWSFCKRCSMLYLMYLITHYALHKQ